MTDDQKVMYLYRNESEPRDLSPEEVLQQAKAIQAQLGL